MSRATAAETEVEVTAATQKIDVYSVPDPAREAERGEMGFEVWEKSVATPLLIHFRLGSDAQSAGREDDVSAEIQAWFKDYKENEQRLRSQARDEGRKDGERNLLLRQLRARFGALPAAAVACIEAAGEAELDQWGERVLDARTLAEVLDGSS